MKRPSPRSKKSLRLARIFCAGTLLALSIPGAHAATTLVWDPTNMGNPPDGGSGNWDLTDTFWFNGTSDVVWPNSGTDIANFTTANAGTVTTTAAIQVNQMIFGTTGYTIANGTGGSLTLTGTTPTINVATGLTDTISAALAGTAGLTVPGAGTLVLAGANTYTGTTTLAAGTLMLSGAGTLGANPTVTFTGSSTLNLGGTTRTLAALTASGTTAQTDVITNGSIGLGAANFTYAPTNGTGTTTTLNMSGLSSFTYAQAATGQSFNIQVPAGTNTTNEVVNLSSATNTITASTLNVGPGSGADIGGTATVNLGTTNALNVDTVQLGGYRGSGGTMQFTAGSTGSSLVMRGAAGGVTPTGIFTIGLPQSGGAGGANNSVFDTTAGLVNAIVNQFNVFVQGTASAAPASGTGAATQSGIFSFANGTVNLGTMSIGATNQTSAVDATTIVATVNQNAGALLADSIVFGNNSVSLVATPVAGINQPNITYTSTYNLGSANTTGILSAGSIGLGAQTANAATLATLNFNNGTITNYDNTANGFAGQGNANGSTTTNQQNLVIAGRTGGGTAADANTLNIVLASTGTHTFAAASGFSITQTNTSLISGAGALTISGTGVVNLNGTNTYSGGTTVNSGKLRIANLTGSATGTGAVMLSGGTTTTLSGTGISTGLLTVTAGSRLAPGVNTSGTNSNFGVAGTLTAGGTNGITLTRANLDFDLANTAVTAGGAVNDLLATAGPLTLGTVGVTINELNGTLLTGTAYTLVNGATSITGLNAGALAAATTFVNGTAYTATYASNGTALTVTFSPVPEPSTGMLMAGGLAGLAGVQRFRRHRAARVVGRRRISLPPVLNRA